MTKFVRRLFLIGNGFDLALGLKTSYSDFLLWLLKKEVIRAIESGVTVAPFPKYIKQTQPTINKVNNERTITIDPIEVKGFVENKLFYVLIEESDQDLLLAGNVFKIQDLLIFEEFTEKYKIKISALSHSKLMQKLLDGMSNNWVDIESIYFNELKKIINEFKKDGKGLDRIELINNELTEITKLLKEYLTEQKISISKDDGLAYLEQFDKPLEKDDFIDYEGYEELIFTNRSYFLNFNYTDSLSEVLAHFPDYQFTQNFIHGSLIDDEDEIIFGFGDEMDPIYEEIEELNDNRFFEHIKSFHYFKTNKQRQLQTFLNSGDYQVCVYGHSCGLSDRVMLNEIFEHENCKSILIYYYTDEDFTTKTMEISRHFNNKQIMRKKIVNKSTDCKIPQIVRP